VHAHLCDVYGVRRCNLTRGVEALFRRSEAPKHFIERAVEMLNSAEHTCCDTCRGRISHNSVSLGAMSVLPQDIGTLIDAAADRYHVPRPLARAVAWVESRGRQSALSSAGAIGVMQLMPETAKSLGVDPHDPAQNIDGGVRFLAKLIATLGSEANALAAYNWGPTRVASRQPWPASVQSYVTSVLHRADVELAQLEGSPTGKLPLLRSRSASVSPPSPDSEERDRDEKKETS
jgi:Transglycosylase SLT domain